MSHVDEGTLHAYLDGELPSADRKSVEVHLAQCDTCRAALTEARALIERASALLGAARPAERPAPPLEHLRRGAKRAPWHVRTSFAWAASIALALGVGYLLRSPAAPDAELDSQRPSANAPTEIATNRTVDRSAPPPQAPALGEQKSSVRAQARREPRMNSAPAEEIERAREKTAQAADTVSVAERLEQRDAAGARPAAENLSDSVLQQRLRETRLDAAVVTGRAAAPAPALAAQDRAPPAEPNIIIDGAVIHPSIAKAWPAVDREVAKSVLGDEPVGLAALPVRGFRRGPGLDGTIVVEQSLDASTVIQIFQRPATDAAPSESRAYTRTIRLARYVGRLRVEIAAPVSLDSLNRLLEQVRPLP